LIIEQLKLKDNKLTSWHHAVIFWYLFQAQLYDGGPGLRFLRKCAAEQALPGTRFYLKAPAFDRKENVEQFIK